mmetsp:Transcript_5508/g.12967  ORF Transcript_5508/g.12967 Transcript_5508/m.12967 type:complete len:559 (+) Transcript_5508:22-1698(+)
MSNHDAIPLNYLYLYCLFLFLPLNTVESWGDPQVIRRQSMMIRRRTAMSSGIPNRFGRTPSTPSIPSLAWTTPTTLSATSSSSWTEIPCIEGPFHVKSFAETHCWGQKPLLLKQSFNTINEPLPNWNDICQLAIAQEEGEAESITSRLITHEPGTLDTFKLEFGPFSESELSNFIDTAADDDDGDDGKNEDSSHVSTLVVNDVDRWIPSLSDWMDQQFGFLPRWRRDDAQVSLARVGGGIGPHVDNYDVFLIQASGTRTWKIGLGTLSVKDEFDNLVEASEVRVLDLDGDFVAIEVGPGDCLYLPPRVVHWGSATSDDCMTLSVGCRAPSASELLQRVAESLSDSSVLATTRYTDIEDITSWSDHDPIQKQQQGDGSQRKDLSKKVKNKMKRLVLDLIEEQLEDDAYWDKLVGELVTEPNRPTMDYPIPLSEMENEWKAGLGVWANSETALERVLGGTGVLRRAEGVGFAWSSNLEENKMGPILFAQGRSFPLNDNSDAALALLDTIANGLPLSRQRLKNQGIQVLSETMKSFLIDLLEEGLLYGDDDDDDEKEDTIL